MSEWKVTLTVARFWLWVFGAIKTLSPLFFAVLVASGVGFSSSGHAGQPLCNVRQQFALPLNSHYYAVQPQSAALSVSPADVNSIIRARQELDRLEAALTQSSLLSAQRLQQQPRIELQAPPVPVPLIQPQALKADPVATIFAKYKCDACHKTTGHTIFAGADISGGKRWEVLGRVASHNMPKGDGETLTQEEVETIRSWAEQGNK